MAFPRISKPSPAGGVTPQSYEGRSEWKARPWLGRAVRFCLSVFPLVIAFVVTYLIGQAVGSVNWGIGLRIGWGIAMFVVASVVASAMAVVCSRFVPLSTLCQLNLEFPEEAPSRLKVALRLGNSANVERVLDEFKTNGLALHPQAAAEQVLILIDVLNRHDRRTRGHSERVRALADVIGEEMGLPEHDRSLLRWAALLHDIGKLTVPAEILNKPGRPTEEEWEILKGHPWAGHDRIAPLTGWLGDWALCVEQHHERFDGTGYPLKLRGDQMPLGSRIVAVADAFEVMTATRSYKKPMSFADARAELVRCSGTHFDPRVVRSFINIGLPQRRITSGFLSSFTGELISTKTIAGKLIARFVDQGIVGISPAAIFGAGAAKAGMVAAALTVATAVGVPVGPVMTLEDGVAPVDSVLELALTDEVLKLDGLPPQGSAPTSNVTPTTGIVVPATDPAVAPSMDAPTTTVEAPIVEPVRPDLMFSVPDLIGAPVTTAAQVIFVVPVSSQPPVPVTTAVPATTALPPSTGVTTTGVTTTGVTTTGVTTTGVTTTGVTSTGVTSTGVTTTGVTTTGVTTTGVTTTRRATTIPTTISISTTSTATVVPTTSPETSMTTSTTVVPTTSTTISPETSTTTTTTTPTTTSTTVVPTSSTTFVPETSTTTTTTISPVTSTTTSTTIPPVQADCWQQEFFGNYGLVGPPTQIPELSDCVKEVFGGYGYGGPHPDLLVDPQNPVGGIRTDNFSARWQRRVALPSPVVARVIHDDGLRVTVDGLVVHDQLGVATDGVETQFVIPASSSPDGRSLIVVEYKELSGRSNFSFSLDPTPQSGPFMKTFAPSNPAATLRTPSEWQIETFASSGSGLRTGNPLAYSNSMNMRLFAPKSIDVKGSTLFIQDLVFGVQRVSTSGAYLGAIPDTRYSRALRASTDGQSVLISFGDRNAPSVGCWVGFANVVTGIKTGVSNGCDPGQSFLSTGLASWHPRTFVQDSAFDSAGNIYLLDHDFVWQINIATSQVIQVGPTNLDKPRSIDWRNGKLVIAEEKQIGVFDLGTGQYVVVIDHDASVINSPTNPDETAAIGVPASIARLWKPATVRWLDDNSFVFTESERSVVRRYSLSDDRVYPIAGQPWNTALTWQEAIDVTPRVPGSTRLGWAGGLAIDSTGLYVVHEVFNSISRIR